MKKQILIIHGGTSFNTYVDYLAYLKTKDINIDKIRPRKDWKDSLIFELGDEYDILLPRMPNVTNARYEEWKIWFKNIEKVIDDPIILIGHSLGGIFLAKYLSENTLPKSIAATILVAAPYDDADAADGRESLADFALPASLAQFEQQSGKIYLMHSKDDPVVPFAQLKKYQQALPGAKMIIFEDREHFNQETFPEITALLKSIE